MNKQHLNLLFVIGTILLGGAAVLGYSVAKHKFYQGQMDNETIAFRSLSNDHLTRLCKYATEEGGIDTSNHLINTTPINDALLKCDVVPKMHEEGHQDGSNFSLHSQIFISIDGNVVINSVVDNHLSFNQFIMKHALSPPIKRGTFSSMMKPP
jgi:hypothetical protein